MHPELRVKGQIQKRTYSNDPNWKAVDVDVRSTKGGNSCFNKVDLMVLKIGNSEHVICT